MLGKCYREKQRREMGTTLRRQHMNKGLKDVREPCGNERKTFLAAGRASCRGPEAGTYPSVCEALRRSMCLELRKREVVTGSGGRSCGAWLATVKTLAFTQGKREPWEGSQQRRDGSDWVIRGFL